MIYKTKPYTHQIEAYDKLSNINYGALLMEQGTGKTKTVVDIVSNNFIQKKIEAVLLVAPNGIQIQWMNEQVPLHSPVRTLDFLWQSKATKKYIDSLSKFIVEKTDLLKWFFVNVEIFQTKKYMNIFKQFLAVNKCAMIIDEATTIKSIGANRTRNIVYDLSDNKKNHLAIFRYILTGTVVTNSPIEIFPMFEFLNHNFFNQTYTSFKNRYSIEKKVTWQQGKCYKRMIDQKDIFIIKKYVEQGMSLVDISTKSGISEQDITYILSNPHQLSPYRRLDELKEKIQPVSFTIKKDQCLDLPEKIYSNIFVEMTSEQKNLCKSLQKNFIASYKNKQLTVTAKIALVTRLMQITGGFFYSQEDNSLTEIYQNPKIIALIRDINDINEQCVIYAHFVHEIEAIYKSILKNIPSKKIGMIHGKVNNEERLGIKNKFINKDIDILVSNVETSGIGHNFQQNSLVYYFSNSYSLYYREQSEDRMHRIGQKKHVVYKDIIAINSIDELVVKKLKEKKDLLEFFRSVPIEEIFNMDKGGYLNVQSKDSA